MRHSCFLNALCITFLAFLCLICVNIASAEFNTWTSIGPKDGPIVALVINPKTPTNLYAWVSGIGLYKSTNGGGDWNLVNDELRPSPYTSPTQLVIDPKNPTTLYATLDFDGVFKSFDGGENWKPVNTGLPESRLEVLTLVIDPTTSNTIFAGTNHGVFKSTNGGESWIAVNTGLMNKTVHALAIDPANHSTIYAGVASGVVKSTNSGESWSLIRPNQTPYILSIAVDPLTPTIVYTGTALDGPFKSTDGGESWMSMKIGSFASDSGPPVFSFLIDPTDSETIYAGTIIGVFKSTDGGESWIALNTGLNDTRVEGLIEVKGLIMHPTSSRMLYAIAGGGLFVLKESAQGGGP